MKVLTLTRYGNLGASSRLRSIQYFAWLGAASVNIIHNPLFNNKSLADRYEQGSYQLSSLIRNYFERLNTLRRRSEFDILWIEKEALPWLPLWVEAFLLSGTPYVLDYDDAVFHNYDKHRNPLVRFFYGRRLDGLMAKAALVIAGNSYLAQRAQQAGARRVEIIPTVIDLNRYPLASRKKASDLDKLPRIVWIGTPATVHYLDLLSDALRELSKHKPFVIRVIGGGQIVMPGVPVEFVEWSESTEVESIASCDVGIMPLKDSFWERGKCGYKLIQYMACSLPVVASPIGVNTEIVQHGVNGYLANTTAEWVDALEALLTDSALRSRMGKAGRQAVEDKYCIQKTWPKMAELLKEAAQGVH